MLEEDLRGRNIRDEAVLSAMLRVPRDRFVDPEWMRYAYSDEPLPIAEHQTISQPYIVAAMAEAAELKPTDRVLEVGTGSGYGAAVLSQLAAFVWTVERHRALAESARDRLHQLGYGNVDVVHCDGSLGWPTQAPFDAIVVTAGASEVPRALIEQLAIAGRMVIPVGPRSSQELVRIRKHASGIQREVLQRVRFVPLVEGALVHR